MKERLDVLLVRKGLCQSRERAKELIKAGQVLVGGIITAKPSELIEKDVEITVTGDTLSYVGRGGLKLEGAIKTFSLDLTQKLCADIGASTGGFTDCMLQNGAKMVYAVDVGHGQLAEKLRCDSRVFSLEGVNARYLTAEDIPEKLDFISVDVSFISVRLILPSLPQLLKEDGLLLVLVKPQFEVGRANIGKNGIVKSEKVHASLLLETAAFFKGLGLFLVGLTASPIKGSDGNAEYLALLSKTDYNNIKPTDFSGLVRLALKK